MSVPWYAKMILKVVLARIPLQYSTWVKLKVFRHGFMCDPDYAIETFLEHFNRAPFARKSSSWIGLELGPGDSLFSGILAALHGASRTLLIDSGRFADLDEELYNSFLRELRMRRIAGNIPSPDNLQDLLQQMQIRYLTEGFASLRSIPDQSVDFIWSHSVLQHLPRSHFKSFMDELRRIIRDDGACSHCVDLRDMLGGGMNNLRFSPGFWESPVILNSGFYTNRIRYHEMLAIFEDVGFGCRVINTQKWKQVPLPRRKLARVFRDVPAESLSVSGFSAVLRPVAPHNRDRPV